MAEVVVTVCNLLPEALYTVLDIGVVNPGPEETIYFGPAGGLGNVIRTDEFGDGELKIDMPWCPTRNCVPGTSVDCQMYFSVFHQANYVIYGGSFGAVFFNPSLPAGVIGSNILWFPLFGELQQFPLNRFSERNCRSRSLQDEDDDREEISRFRRGVVRDRDSEDEQDDALTVGDNMDLYDEHIRSLTKDHGSFYTYTIDFGGITIIQMWMVVFMVIIICNGLLWKYYHSLNQNERVMTDKCVDELS